MNRTSCRAKFGETILSNQDLAVLLLESFRYCLGRMTYAVGRCVEMLTTYWDIMPPNWQEQIHRDIKEAIERGGAGMDCDVAKWEKILKLPLKDDDE